MTAGIDFDPAEREAIASEMNLSVLKRADPAIQLVLKSASHVVLYRMLEGVPEWRRCDVEGSLFIVERNMKKSTFPDRSKHRIVIINRKSPENHSDDIVVGNKELERNDKMIMYNNAQGSTMGIWFYEVDEAVAVFDLLQKIVNSQPVPKPSPPTRPKRVNKRSAALKNTAGNRRSPKAASPKATQTGAKQQQSQSTANTTEQTENPLQRFFPDLKLTDGVAGEAVPANAPESSEFEKNGARPPEGNATAEKPAAQTSTEPIPDVSTIESTAVSTTATEAAAKTSPKASGKAANKPAHKAAVASQNKASGKQAAKSGGKSSGRPAVRTTDAGNSSNVSAAPGTSEADETQRIMQMQAMLHAQNVQMQEARRREMEYRFRNGGDISAGQAAAAAAAAGPMMGAQAALPLQHFGGGVHPQMAMMMHPMHQMYMHHYMANMQQQQQQQMAAGEEPAKELMRMLKVEQDEGPEKEARVARALAEAGRQGQLGVAKWDEVDRVSFRAVIQRMLTDRKLFDSVYEHYVGSANELYK